MNRTISLLVTFILAMATLSFEVPKGWHKAGSRPDSYDMGIDPGAGRKHNRNAATIKSNEANIDGFGTLMQTFSADEYKGKKIRLTGYLRSVNVDGWAGLWLRVDGPKKGKSLAFDNMYNRAIKGTQDWTKCEIVLKVPENATNIAFGALLDGGGQIWFDELEIEVASEKSATTQPRQHPVNLNFED